MQKTLKTLAATCSAILLVAACGGGGGGDDAPGVNTNVDGTLTLEMGDAPVDNLSEVNITVTAIEFGGDEGSTSDEAEDTVTIDPPKSLNLLDHQAIENFYVLLDSVEVKEGDYEWIRLRLDYDDNPPEVLEQGGITYKDLDIPSGEQTGLKLTGGGTLSIDGNGDHHYAIDLDLHRSLKLTGSGTYKLKPTYRLIDLDGDVFSVSGQIDVTRPVGCSGAVYVYKNYVDPDDIENPDNGTTIAGTDSADSVEPFIVELVGSLTTFTVEGLTAGRYTFAYTCEVDDDDPDEDNDDVTFLGEINVSVSSDMTNVDISD